jgi:hypothetical protein
MNDLWYEGGLRFACRKCGACCTGTPGYVWVTDREIVRLARAVGFSVDDFRRRFVCMAKGKMSLIEMENGDCVLYDAESRGCRVYEDRPIQCRTWPFWPSNIKSRRAWKLTARECPGCDQGTLVSKEEIEKIADSLDI